jgi:hypothetical protein
MSPSPKSPLPGSPVISPRTGTSFRKRKRCLEHQGTNLDTGLKIYIHQQDKSDQPSLKTRTKDDPNTPAARQSRDVILKEDDLSYPCPQSYYKYRRTAVSHTKSPAIASVGCDKDGRRQKPDTCPGISRYNVCPLYPIISLSRLHDSSTDLVS